MRRTGRTLALRLGANESPFGPSPSAVAAMREAAIRVHRYGDPEGFDLRSAIAGRLGISLDQVTLGSGIDDLLLLVCRTFLNPGTAAVMSLGGYPTFAYAARGVGATVHTTPYSNDGNDIQRLADLARETSARVVYLANPDNPTGSWLLPEAVLQFRNALPQDCLLLLDEAYFEFAPAAPIISVDDPGVIRLRTFSKAHGMAGARIGYAIACKEACAEMEKIRLHFGVNLVAQAGALASLEDRSYVESVIQRTASARTRLAQIAVSVGMAPLPSATNFVTMDAGSRVRAEAILTELLERDVFIRKPGAAPFDRCIRVTVGTEAQMDLFAEHLRQVVSRI